MTSLHKEYIINGIKVCFPCTPYKSQIVLMDKIIKSLKHKKNALLESPTGTGKTLALLCATLAWQKNEKERLLNDNLMERQRELETIKDSPIFSITKNEVEEYKSFYENNEDFQSSECLSLGNKFHPVDSFSDDTKVKTKIKNVILPKVYYASRTHRQLNQVISELKRTKYNDVKMSILSSRDYSCIHPIVSRSSNKSDMCRVLLDKKECQYTSKIGKMKFQDQLPSLGIDKVWDIEDLVSLGKKVRACPFFCAKGLAEGADIIFCPYNYIIDKLIRDNMGSAISLENCVIILDEAHNIEDMARESSSCSINSKTLSECSKFLNEFHSSKIQIKEAALQLSSMCNRIVDWMDETSDTLVKESYDKETIVHNSDKMLSIFNLLNLDAKNFEKRKSDYKTILKDQAEENEEEEEEEEDLAGQELKGEMLKSKLPSFCTNTIESLFMSLENIHVNNSYAKDYKMALTKSYSARSSFKVAPQVNTKGGWFAKKARIKEEHEWLYQLHLWCLNPAIAFSHITANMSSLILTSGTLSPLDSFESELSMPFTYRYEASHVIPHKDVWVGALSHGIKEKVLDARFSNVDSLSFQDDVGAIILQICKVVDGGVLCFLPSYSLLDRMMKRWKISGIYADIQSCRNVFIEPQGRGNDEFTKVINSYYYSIDCWSKNSKKETLDESLLNNQSFSDPENGIDDSEEINHNLCSLLFAVYRGKVSEGIDFSNDNARCVITIGIPYPNFKNKQVEIKRQYNDAYRTSKKNLLSGSRWYEVQAFRALNQALGRCIRHSKDWGAMLMLDYRLASSSPHLSNSNLAKSSQPPSFSHSTSSKRGLSKWIRNWCQDFQSYSHMMTSLTSFMDEHSSSASPSDHKLPSINDSCEKDNSQEVIIIEDENERKEKRRWRFKSAQLLASSLAYHCYEDSQKETKEMLYL